MPKEVMGRDPRVCPYCGGKNITTYMVLWDAVSTEERTNTAKLNEHQCFDCDNRSFWS